MNNLRLLRRFLPIVLSAIGLTACMPTRVVKLNAPVAEPGGIQVTDHRIVPEDRAYLSGGGNIYSCLYGITRIKEAEVIPERLEYLRSALNASAARAKVRTVSIDRFDVYVNAQAELKNLAAGMGGTQAGSFIAGAIQGAVREGVTHNGALIGCEGKNAGEYWTDEITDLGQPAIVYLEGNADATPFKIRQVLFAKEKNIFEPANWSAHAAAAIGAATQSLIDILRGSGEEL